MDSIASQITSPTIVYSTVHSGSDQRKHQSSASLAFVWEIHRWPVNFPHKWPVTRKMFPFDDVIRQHTLSTCVHPLSGTSLRFSRFHTHFPPFSRFLTRSWLLPTLLLHRNERDGVSNHQPRDYLLNRLFRRRSKKTSKLRVTGLCAENSPVTGEFPAQRAINAEMFPFHDVIVNMTASKLP